MLPRSQRLSSAQFDRAFALSQSVRHPLLALKAHFRDDGLDAVRAAFVVPKKQGRAVQRNRARRRLRERYRLHARREELRGCDLIFLSTPATHDASGDELDAALDEVIKRIKRKLGEKPNNTRAGFAPSSNRVAGENQSLEEGGSPADISLAATPKAVPTSRVEEDATPAPAHPIEPDAQPQTSLFAWPALAVIRFYQRFVSPGLPPSCRFYPSCSRYTYGAIERFGLGRGLWLGAYRVCRCHPWNAGGVDEVPAQFPAPRLVKARAVEKFKALLARRRFDSPRN